MYFASQDGILERDETGVFEGEEESKQHEYANGCFYDGNWKANRKHGQGTFKWPSGAIFTGEFKDDKRHGEGKFTYADKSTYNGGWVNDKRNGRGVFKWPDGS